MEPHPGTAWGFAYGGYLAWLLAGSGDFFCHRRTHLATTSGIAESAAHLVQLALLALAIVLGLALRPSVGLLVSLGVLVVMHAIVGYVDTRTAFSKGRVILPVEQHLHSILDMAPIIGYAVYAAWAWPEASAGGAAFGLRDPPPGPAGWAMVLLPAIVLCVLPALLEFRSAWKARWRDAGSLRRT